MQITALIQVINYLKEISENPVMLDSYKKLTGLVKEASGSLVVDNTDEILKEKEHLWSILQESDPINWGHSSYCLFEKINRNRLFGKSAAYDLEGLIASDNQDFKTAYSELSKKIKLISKFSDTLNRFLQMFDQIVQSDIFQLSEESEARTSLYLYFEGRLSVQNITDMDRYSRLWDGILTSFSMLTDEEKLMPDIRSFQNGNVVLGVAAQDKTLDAIVTGVTGILISLPSILKIRKIQLEIASLALHNDLNEFMEEEIQILISQNANELTQKLISLYSNSTLSFEDMNNDISRSLKQILNFVEKGGRIEFTPSDSNKEQAKINITLNNFYAISKELEIVKDSLLQVQAQTQEKLYHE
jgi:hypothetical protein